MSRRDPRLTEIVQAVDLKSKGQLYATIHRLVDNEAAEAICFFFGVSETMTAREESALVTNWFDYRIWKWPYWNPVVALTPGEKWETAYRMLRAALMLIGYWHCRKANRLGDVPLTTQLEARTASASSSVTASVKATLALVIRSSEIGSLPAATEPLSAPRVIDLIAGAVYFRCVLPSEADAKEKELGLNENAGLTADPQRQHDVYLRLEIEDGSDLLEAESFFALKNRFRDRPSRQIHLTRRERLDCPVELLHDFHSI